VQPQQGIVEVEKTVENRNDPQPKREDVVDAAFKVLKPDELQVIEILKRNGNHYLQKWIAKEGDEPSQTHRGRGTPR
jgi:uncharacterized membrane protein